MTHLCLQRTQTLHKYSCVLFRGGEKHKQTHKQTNKQTENPTSQSVRAAYDGEARAGRAQRGRRTEAEITVGLLGCWTDELCFSVQDEECKSSTVRALLSNFLSQPPLFQS